MVMVMIILFERFIVTKEFIVKHNRNIGISCD